MPSGTIRRMASGLKQNLSGVALAAAGLLGLGVGTGLAISTQFVDGAPPGIEGDFPIVVDVAVSQFDEAIDFPLIVTATQREPLHFNVTGRVTAVQCQPGQPLASGDIVGAVDGRRIRSLATTTPLWRDLSAGDAGEDVGALQQELSRLGYTASSSGRLDAPTVAAVRTWLGQDAPPASNRVVLPLAAVVWSPLPVVIPAACDAVLGGAVSIGEPMLTPAPAVTHIAVPATASPLPGVEHRLTLGSVSVPLPPDGVVVDAQDLATLSRTPQFASWLSEPPGDRRLVGKVSLNTPITVGSVPPAAVIAVASASPCLIDPSGAVTPVLVVSSRLGQTLVTAAKSRGSLPSQTVVDPTGRRTCTSD